MPMWFKNLRLFRLTRPFTLSAEELHDRLSAHAFRKAGSQELSSLGWVPPVGGDAVSLTHGAGGFILLCAQREDKVLPATVVRQTVDERAQTLQEQRGRRLGRKERLDLKDEVMQDLLPRAFSRSTLQYAYIAPKDGWIVVDAAAARRAEELLGLLRESIGTLPVQPPAVVNGPSTVLSRWLLGEIAPADFLLEDECELRDPEVEGAVVRIKGEDLGADEILAHLRAGKRAVKVALSWSERLSCVLDQELAVRRLRFLEVVQEEAGNDDAADAAARFDADFALMTLELSRFIPRLLKLFGGEDTSAYGTGAGAGGMG